MVCWVAYGAVCGVGDEHGGVLGWGGGWGEDCEEVWVVRRMWIEVHWDRQLRGSNDSL